MDSVATLRMEDFRLPENAKVTRVMNRLNAIQERRREQAAAQGLFDSFAAYDESYSAHNNDYGIGF